MRLGRAARASASRRTHWRDARWCAVDFELTGLDPRHDQIIAFGAVPIDEGRVRLGRAVSSLVRPTRESREPAVLVHGIRNEDLVRARPLAHAVESLQAAISGRALIFHSAAVDRPFLEQALGARLRAPVVDTQVLGRLWLYEREQRLPRHLSLTELATALGLPADRPHDALADALTTAQVFLALATHLDAMRPQTVGTLAGAHRGVDAIALFDDHAHQ